MKTSTKFLLAWLGMALSQQAMPLTFATDPLFLASTEPRVMLLLSRDHELSKKAYTDYTDLNNDGLIDTTYVDTVSYYGYFDSNRCYTYSSGNSRFEPAAAATGTNLHHCSGQWSGNFLNWATMTRLDVVRKVFYGGFRSTDNTGTALGATVLERAFLPPDVHAFAKVYAPNGASGNGSATALYTPYNEDEGITLCNVSNMSAGTQAGSISTVNNVATASAPLIKVARKQWAQWATTEILQCQWQEDFVEGSLRPTKSSERLTGSSDLVARVAVCAPSALENTCKSYYTRASPPVETIKPTGLLQQYGDVDETKRVRFGLMTGSYKKNTAGAVLRKNIKFIANNSGTAITSTSICGDNHADDEINVCTGQFINQDAADTGIIDTLNRIHIAGYKTPNAGSVTSTDVCEGGYDYGSPPFKCTAGTLLGTSPGENNCVDWGNPLSEMYLEALRYFAGKPAATTAYAVDDGASGIITGLGQATWSASSDPLPSTEWCALSNIIVLSTGLTSLDNANISTNPPNDISGLNPATLTQEVGAAEGINGASWLVGSNGSTVDEIVHGDLLGRDRAEATIRPEQG